MRLTLSLLVSGVRFADNVEVAVVSLSRLASDNLRAHSVSLVSIQPFPRKRSYLAVLASLLDGTVHLHAANLLLRRRRRGEDPRERRQHRGLAGAQEGRGGRGRRKKGTRGERARRESQCSEYGRHCGCCAWIGFVVVVVDSRRPFFLACAGAAPGVKVAGPRHDFNRLVHVTLKHPD